MMAGTQRATKNTAIKNMFGRSRLLPVLSILFLSLRSSFLEAFVSLNKWTRPRCCSFQQQGSRRRDFCPRATATTISENLPSGQTGQYAGIDSTDEVASALLAYTKNEGSGEGAKNAERILLRLEEENSPSLTKHHYTIVIEAHIQSGNVDGAVSVIGLMEAASPSVQPRTSDYNDILAACARDGLVREAEMLIKRMVDRCKDEEGKKDSVHGQCICEPDLASYNFLLDALAKSSIPGAGKRAREILIELQKSKLDTCSRTYSAVIQAIIRGKVSGQSAMKQAEFLFQQSKEAGIEADIYLKTALLDAYASNFEDSSAPEKAEEMLCQMEAEGSVNAVAYNTVLKAWKGSRNNPNAPARAEAILKRMEEKHCADTISYTTVIGAYANQGTERCAERANEILKHMQKAFEQGDDGAMPNRQTYNAVMHAWVQCGNLRRAEDLLNKMEQFEKDGVAALAPNVVGYSTIMSGWAKSGGKDAVDRVVELFGRMQEAYSAGNKDACPNVFSYVVLINAFLKSNHEDAAQKAEDALMTMYEQYKQSGKNKDLKPNTQIVTSVINCWAKSGKRNAGEKAELLLDWMIDAGIQPNEYTFNTVIGAWGKSRSLGKAIRSRKVLNRMIDLHRSGDLDACPNSHCFTAVINSCAYCENDEFEKSTALKIAIATYKDLLTSSYGTPNQFTFSALLTAIRNLHPEDQKRSSAITTIFQSAAKAGYVNDLVVRRVQWALPTEELHKLFPNALSNDGQIQFDLLPAEWSRKT